MGGCYVLTPAKEEGPEPLSLYRVSFQFQGRRTGQDKIEFRWRFDPSLGAKAKHDSRKDLPQPALTGRKERRLSPSLWVVHLPFPGALNSFPVKEGSAHSIDASPEQRLP